MEGTKRTRAQTGELDSLDGTMPGKRPRHGTGDLPNLMPRTQPMQLAAAPAVALSPFLLRASTKIAPSAHSTVENQVTQRIQAVVHDGWMRKCASYSGMQVLMMFWEVDEPDLGRDIASLEDLLTDTYNCYVETIRLKPGAQTQDVAELADSFVRRTGTGESLLMLYYVGESRPGVKTGDSPIWAPRKSGITSIQSGPIQRIFEEADCDVFLLYDACIAAPPQNANSASSSGRSIKATSDVPAAGYVKTVTEVLAAGTFNGQPLDNNNGSAFTRALTDELSTVPKLGIRVTDLQQRLSSRLVTLKPRGRGRPPKDPQLRAMDGQHVPVHAWVTGPNRVIALAPIKDTDDPEVILCIRWLGVDLAEWIAWISRAHAFIVVEAAHAGTSTMLILRVPHNIWLKLPECPTEGLIGFSTAGQFTKDMAEQVDDVLAIKMGTEEDPEVVAAAAASAAAAYAAEMAASAAATASATRVNTIPGPGHTHTADEEGDGGYSLRTSPKKTRKALPSGRKLLPSDATEPAQTPESHGTRDKQDVVGEQATPASPTAHKVLAPTRNGAKVSIQSAGQLHYCSECKGLGFKDEEALGAHMRKQHVRPFQCVYNWAGCESTFASKNEWKRHVMSQHILLHIWVCELDACAKSGGTSTSAVGARFADANGQGRIRGVTLPPGAAFNRKDLYTQHLRRMHAPQALRGKTGKTAKAANRAPANEDVIKGWEERVKHLQQVGQKDRIKLPTYMRCPAQGCAHEFTGLQAWDDRMEHVAKHLEAAARDLEPAVVFGGPDDPTLVEWSTRPDVSIVWQNAEGVWQLDNPLNSMRPPSAGSDSSAGHEPERERSKSVIEVGVGEAYSPTGDDDEFDDDDDDDVDA